MAAEVSYSISRQQEDRVLMPGPRSGTVTAPPSKSQLLRLLLLTVLGGQETKLLCHSLCDDAEACISCLEALGAKILREADGLRVCPASGTGKCRGFLPAGQENSSAPEPGGWKDGYREADSVPAEFFCGESASVLRFLLPVLGALGRPAVFHLEGRLPERPLEPYAELLRAHGMRIRQENTLLFAEGRLAPGCFRIPGNISSQYISGLLMALPLLSGESTLEVTGPVESEGYIRMTEEALELGGIRILKEELPEQVREESEEDQPGRYEKGRTGGQEESRPDRYEEGQPGGCEEDRPDGRSTGPGAFPEKGGHGRRGLRWRISGGQRYLFPERLQVEGDYSAAAFFFCMGALSEEGILVRGLRRETRQGDSRILELLRTMGAELRYSGEDISVRGRGLRGCRIDASGIPDLVPVLAVAAAAAEGKTEFFHASRLRFKESDRLRSTAELITALGGSALETEDGLMITGTGKLAGGTADPHGDHRVAMAAAAAACISETPVTVKNSGCTAKSFPAFWEEFEGLKRSGRKSTGKNS